MLTVATTSSRSLAAGPAGYADFLNGVMTMFSYMRHCPNALVVDVVGDTANIEENSVLYGTMAGTAVRACVHSTGRCVRTPTSGANTTGWKLDLLNPTFDFFVSTAGYSSCCMTELCALLAPVDQRTRPAPCACYAGPSCMQIRESGPGWAEEKMWSPPAPEPEAEAEEGVPTQDP